VEYLDALGWAESQLPGRAVVLCMQVSGAMYYYSGRPMLRYDTVKPDELARAVGAARAAGGAPYALLFEFEIDNFLRRAPGAWEQIGRRGRASLWRPRDQRNPAESPPGRVLGSSRG
jgi:hypothetical protein